MVMVEQFRKGAKAFCTSICGLVTAGVNEHPLHTSMLCGMLASCHRVMTLQLVTVSGVCQLAWQLNFYGWAKCTCVQKS